MRRPDKYEVVREYDNHYGLEELVRRIVRCHLEDGCGENAEPKLPEYTAARGSEPLLG